MRLTNLYIIFSVLTVRICFSGIIIETSKRQQSRLLKAAVNVLKNCYVNRVSTVGLAGNAAGLISEPSWLREHISVTLIDKTQRIVSHDTPVPPEFRYRLQLFVIVATSSITLTENLKEIKESKWWNHMASVLIVDWSMQGCSNRFEVLWTAWEMDLLDSNFMCLHETKGCLIYTYNPYTSKAPKPWNLENTYRGKNNHTWTLFVRRYQEDKNICEKLDFDKTNDLGGYIIRTSLYNMTGLFVEINPKKNGTERLTGLYAEVAWTLFRGLNATPMILEPTDYGEEEPNGKFSGVLGEIKNGISDFAVNVRYRLYYENITVTYPFWETGLYIMSQYRGSASQLSKIASLIDSYTKLGVCLVCLITVLFFAYFLHYSLSSAILNTILLICNAALLKMPTKLAPRIYLATIFILVLNIQGMYQGKLASLLTMKVGLKNVETVRDLSEYGFTVYGPAQFTHYFNKSSRVIFLTGTGNIEECFDQVRQNYNVACALERNAMLSYAASFELHVSAEPIAKAYWTYGMRDNWPPEKKLNRILRRLVEADIIQIMYDKELRYVLRRLQAVEDMKNDQSFKILTLPDLSFAFVILIIGLTCAFIYFIIEIGMTRIQSQGLFHLWP